MKNSLTEESSSSSTKSENFTVAAQVSDGSNSDDARDDYHYEEPPIFRNAMYHILLWLLTTILHCFFREIRSRGGFKVPTDGPVIFVAAPHANQFVDPFILMSRVKEAANRKVSFLIAESSLKHPVIGFIARCVMTIGVVRIQDNLKPARGKITVDPDNPKRIIGIGTMFKTDFEAKGLIGLPKNYGSAEIQSIESETVLYLRKEFKLKADLKSLLTTGTPYKYAPKVNQSQVYHRVFEHLAHNHCIGIFPEGGSHDRTDLLPLKAGVAIMALGAMSKHRNINVKIVPCGMNYFHAHKFRSRAVVEFGDPIEITSEMIQMYGKAESKQDAVKKLLGTITEALRAVTVTSPDYETLMVVQAMRRLYIGNFTANPPLPLVVEMNRRLVKGYQVYRDDPKVQKLTRDILLYNSHLKSYSLPDHLVEEAKFDFSKTLILLITRSLRILIMFCLALPGITMFSPVFLMSKRISKQKAEKALASSSVKIKANDVLATWKILIAMGIAPLLYTFWSILITFYMSGHGRNNIVIFGCSYALCVGVTYSALIVGDIGVDLLKSLRPLYLSLTSPTGLKKLHAERRALSERITEIVNTFGSELFPDFTNPTLLEDERKAGNAAAAEDLKANELKRRRLVKKRNIKKKTLDLSKRDNSPSSGTESDAVSLINSDSSFTNIPLFSSSMSLQGSVSSGLDNSTSGSDIEYEKDSSNTSKEGELAGIIAKTLMTQRLESDIQDN